MKLSSSLVWMFIPWSAFWQKDGASLRDHAFIPFGLSASSRCVQVNKVYQGVIALQETTQVEGLSHRTQQLSDTEAMLFINIKPKKVTFWMFQTYIPLDIAYYDARGRLRESYFMPVEQDPSNPSLRYPSQVNVQVAIEMKPAERANLWSHPYLCVGQSKSM